ncbi:MAG: TIGR01906 family membrane protein [Anaerolineae bacterium]|nr:MAG: TIGR01906 family membrane protein [Anaerolineae bacterium]
MKTISQAAAWLVTLLVPVILVLGTVRLLLTPLFIQIEYRLPNFPPDTYGFTQAERLKWADVARRYLLNDAGIDFLGDLQFEDGTPLYNERELRHMLDVKIVVRRAMAVLYFALLLCASIGFWFSRSGRWWDFRIALARGGWLTVGLLAALLLGIALSFNVLFVAFHRIFFEGDTWIFRYSDTLIRLFPVRFWQDAFLTTAGIPLLAGWLLARQAGWKNRSSVSA